MKELAALISAAAALIGTLLALGVIKPFGDGQQEDSPPAIGETKVGGGNGNVAGQAIVPDVTGMTVEDAQHELELSGFARTKVDKIPTMNDSLIGKAVSTSPPDGWKWPTNEQIKINVGEPFFSGG